MPKNGPRAAVWAPPHTRRGVFHNCAYIGNDLDLFVLHLVEDIGVAQGFQEKRPAFVLSVKELDKLLQLSVAFFKVPGELLSSRLI